MFEFSGETEPYSKLAFLIDNQGVMKRARNEGSETQIKHIDIKYHLVSTWCPWRKFVQGLVQEMNCLQICLRNHSVASYILSFKLWLEWLPKTAEEEKRVPVGWEGFLKFKTTAFPTKKEVIQIITLKYLRHVTLRTSIIFHLFWCTLSFAIRDTSSCTELEWNTHVHAS